MHITRYQVNNNLDLQWVYLVRAKLQGRALRARRFGARVLPNALVFPRA